MVMVTRAAMWLVDRAAICTCTLTFRDNKNAAAHTPTTMQVGTITVSARFTDEVPASEMASALAGLDVLMSAVGVAAPVAGGFLLDGVAAARQPLVGAALHAAVLLVVLVAFAPGGGAGVAAASKNKAPAKVVKETQQKKKAE
jgi:hypothetical protein